MFSVSGKVCGRGMRLSRWLRKPRMPSSAVSSEARSMMDENKPQQKRSLGDDSKGDVPVEERQAKEVIFDPMRRPILKLTDDMRDHLKAYSGSDQSSLRRRGMAAKIGTVKFKTSVVPEKINHALDYLFRNEKENVGNRVTQYIATGEKLRRYLLGRHPPQEKDEWNRKMAAAKATFEKEYEDHLLDDSLPMAAREQLSHDIHQMAEKYVERKTYRWKPVHYDEITSFAYLLGKAPFDYACIYKILKEIKRRDPDFQPRTLLDFGSGVGTSVWAVNEIFGQLTEVMGIDTSPEMNDLARTILMQGKPGLPLPAGYFFKMHLPMSNELTYDLVTCCFSLLELPSAEARLTTIDNLWRKARPFLIVVEEGTNAGFQVLSEVRDYLIQLSRPEAVEKTENSEVYGHVYAPCPHSGPCPRYFHDRTPCCFDVKYKTFQIKKVPSDLCESVQMGKFSYLVFKKGDLSETADYPRVVSEPLHRRNHIVCRMCTHREKLEEFVSTRRQDHPDAKLLYRYMKRLHSGDQVQAIPEDANGKTGKGYHKGKEIG